MQHSIGSHANGRISYARGGSSRFKPTEKIQRDKAVYAVSWKALHCSRTVSDLKIMAMGGTIREVLPMLFNLT